MEYGLIHANQRSSPDFEPFGRFGDSGATMANMALDRQLADLNALLEVSHELGATTELMPLLQKVECALRQVLDCERGTVFLYDKETNELYSLVATGEETIRFPANLGIAGQAFQTGSPINVKNAYSNPHFNPAIDRKTGYHTRSLLTFPMRGYDGSIVGVLEALNKRGGTYDNLDEERAADLGMLAGVAIQRQMLLDEYAKKQQMERDLALARDIQQKLLPKSNPEVSGYEIAGWNKPADATGGDCYDYIPLQDGRHCILMADAMGHGIGPALIVAECRALVLALASTSNDPAKIMGQVNQMMTEDLDSGHFVTTFFGVLDPFEHCVRYLSAGYGPLLHYRRAKGECRKFTATTCPLGIVTDFEHLASESIALEPGDLLVLTTDGFYEWTNPDGELFGIKRLSAVIHEYRDHSPDEIIGQLYRKVLEFGAGAPQSDDLTAVIIRRV